MRCLFILFIHFLLLTSHLAAQTPIWTSAHITPSALFDAAGNTYTYGNFTTTVTVTSGVTLTSVGTANAYVASFAPDGSLTWVRQLTGNVTLDRVKVSEQGIVTIAAHYQYTAQVGRLTATTPIGDPAQNGLLVARLDTQGQPLSLWPILYTVQSTVANNAFYGWMQTMDLGQDAAGNVYLAAWQRGRLLVGTTVVYGSVTTGLNQVILKINAQGTLEWVHQGGYLSTVAGYTITVPSLVVSADGNVFFMWNAPCCPGDFENLVTPRSGGDLAPVIVKYTTQGTPTWIKRFTDYNYTLYSGGAVTPTGDLVVGVIFRFGISFDSYTFGNPPGAVLVRLSGATGIAVAAVPSVGYGSPFATDANGNIYQGGPLGASCLSPNFSLRWNLKATSNGISGSSYPIITANNLMLTGNRILLSGSAYYSSYTQSNTLTFGATTLTFPINSSLITNYLAEINNLPLASRLPATKTELAFYPNPIAVASDLLNLPSLPVGTELLITDALGREVCRRLAAASLKLPSLAPGVYVIHAQAPNGTQWLGHLEVQ